MSGPLGRQNDLFQTAWTRLALGQAWLLLGSKLRLSRFVRCGGQVRRGIQGRIHQGWSVDLLGKKSRIVLAGFLGTVWANQAGETRRLAVGRWIVPSKFGLPEA